MGIFDRIIKRNSVEKIKLVEKSVLSMITPTSEPTGKVYRVGEVFTLMGSQDQRFINGLEIIKFNPGDELLLYDLFPDPIQINVFNAEHPRLAQSFYVVKDQIKDRKIKINPKKPKYAY